MNTMARFFFTLGLLVAVSIDRLTAAGGVFEGVAVNFTGDIFNILNTGEVKYKSDGTSRTHPSSVVLNRKLGAVLIKEWASFRSFDISLNSYADYVVMEGSGSYAQFIVLDRENSLILWCWKAQSKGAGNETVILNLPGLTPLNKTIQSIDPLSCYLENYTSDRSANEYSFGNSGGKLTYTPLFFGNTSRKEVTDPLLVYLHGQVAEKYGPSNVGVSLIANNKKVLVAQIYTPQLRILREQKSFYCILRKIDKKISYFEFDPKDSVLVKNNIVYGCKTDENLSVLSSYWLVDINTFEKKELGLGQGERLLAFQSKTKLFICKNNTLSLTAFSSDYSSRSLVESKSIQYTQDIQWYFPKNNNDDGEDPGSY